MISVILPQIYWNIQLIRRKGIKFSAFTPFRDFLKKIAAFN